LQIGHKEIGFEQIEQTEVEVIEERSDAYSLFVYAIRSQVTKDYYLRRLRIFFNHINLLPSESMKERCNLFAAKGKRDSNWAFSCVVKFLQYQKERVEREEITGATLRNFVKAINAAAIRILHFGPCFIIYINFVVSCISLPILRHSYGVFL
jgi:hypothetical protein